MRCAMCVKVNFASAIYVDVHTFDVVSNERTNCYPLSLSVFYQIVNPGQIKDLGALTLASYSSSPCPRGANAVRVILFAV